MKIKKELVNIILILIAQILCGYIFSRLLKKNFNLKEFFTNYVIIIFWTIYFIIRVIADILIIKRRK